MKTGWLASIVLLSGLLLASAWSNFQGKRPPPANRSQRLAAKVFPFFTDLEADPVFFVALQKDSELASLRKGYRQRLARSLDTCSIPNALAAALKWREDEIATAQRALTSLFDRNMQTALHDRLMKSPSVAAYKSSDAKALLQRAWLDAARGINRIIDVYMAAVPPHYAAIDSVMVNVRSANVFRRLCDSIKQVLASPENDQAFYTLPLAVAVKVLQFSKREEAIRYEPITAGINQQAREKVAQVHFSEFPYSAILVPGFGPEEPGISIDHRSIARCKMAVEQFRKKLAPFIMVSGGHVYPAGTPFSEGVEMKKYLISHGGIPPEAIITEPYARHTTTNVRNASRLVYLFGLPAGKPVLVCTDSMQTQMVVNLAARCTRELGYVPFRNVTQLSTTTSSFYPVEEAFQVNANDPLDP